MQIKTATHFLHFRIFCDTQKTGYTYTYMHSTVLSNTGETHTCTWLTQPLGASSRRACPWWGSASVVRFPSSTPTLYWTVPQWSQNCLVSQPLSDIPRRSELCLQEPMITTSFFKCPHGFWFIECDIPLKSCPNFFLVTVDMTLQFWKFCRR